MLANSKPKFYTCATYDVRFDKTYNCIVLNSLGFVSRRNRGKMIRERLPMGDNLGANTWNCSDPKVTRSYGLKRKKNVAYTQKRTCIHSKEATHTFAGSGVFIYVVAKAGNEILHFREEVYSPEDAGRGSTPNQSLSKLSSWLVSWSICRLHD